MANPDSTHTGSPSNDSLYGGSGRDWMRGLAGNDWLSGAGGDDTLEGGDGNDTLIGDAGNDSLVGGAGSDTLNGGAGNDALIGGAILDRINLTDLNFSSFSSATSGVNVNLATGIAQDGLGGTDTLQDINFVQGSGFADTLTGSTSFNLFEQFEGMSGNDTIDGGVIDPITGNNGNRVAYHNSSAGVTVNLGTGTASDGFGGTDTLININQVRGSNHADVLTGSDNTAYTEAFEGRAGNDTMDGKGGNDQVRYDPATSAVNVNLITGIAQDGQGGTDSLLNIEGIRGSNFNDVLTGGNASNGSGATDGFEFFQGNAGNDTIDGGAGYDRVDFGSSTSGVNVVLGGAVNGTAQDGLGGTDTLISIEAVRGSDFNDVLTGSDTGVFESFEGRAGNDMINGMGGADRVDYSGDWAAVNVNLATGLALDGFGGTDTLINIEQVRGSAFDDTIVGSSNNEILQGNGGNDTLTGGGGNDTFLFANGGQGADLITDFAVGDTINVRMLLSMASPTIGDGSTVSSKGIQVLSTAGVTTLYVDTNNVAGAEEQIRLAGVYSAAGFSVAKTPEGYTNIIYTGSVSSGGDITGTTGNDSLVGGVLGDSIIGLDGNDTLIGGHGNDTLLGRAGDDSLSGGAGSDFLSGEAGNDTLDGGVILDRTNYTDLNTVSYITASGGIVMNLQTGVVSDGFGFTDTVSNVNFVTASNQSDSITGSSTFNLFEHFEGLGGNDTINGGAIDTITGNNGNRVEYGASPFAVNVSLLSGTAQDGFGGTDTLININQVRGSNFNDTLTGSDTTLYTEFFQGRGGNDTINGMGGNDQVRYDSATTGVNVNLATGVATDGQGGTDTLQNIEGIRGSNFNDSLTGGNPSNGSGSTDGFEFFEGRAGNDTIDGGTGYDRADYISSTAGVNVILGGTVNGTAQDGWGGIDTLTSIEAVRGSEFGDVITGSDSGTFESFEGRAGNDTINGIGGTDRADYSGDWAAVNVNLATGIALDGFGDTDRLANIEQARGSAFNDTLIGGNGANLLDGRSGDDILDGGFGSDTLTGGAGLDTFFVSAGVGDVDRITDLAAGEQVGLSGGSGFDLNTQVLTGSDASTLSQGRMMVAPVSGGVTRVFLGLDSLPGADVTVDLVGTYAANDFVVAFNQDSVRIQYSPTGISKTGSAADEWIYGSNYNDTLSGSSGNDSILGYGGNDSLSGGDGDDHLAADGGTDTVDGGNGTDMVHYDLPGAMASGVVINLQAGTAISAGVTDTLISIEGATGTELADTLTGTSGANNLEGAGGNDLMFGQAVSVGTAGSAYLASATGGDTILGGGGNDTIQGGAGNDVLYGGYNESNNGQIGMGSDTFAFAASGNGLDVIGDFSADDAVLVGANIKVGPSTAGNGTAVSGNSIQVSNANGITTLFIDTNNVSGSDITIQLNGNFDATGFSAKQNGNGTSTITYSPPPQNLVGTAGTDSLIGAEGHDTLSGLDGSDSLNGNGGNDSILGGAGSDTLAGGAGNDTLDGGTNDSMMGGWWAGDRAVYWSAPAAVNVNLATGTASDGQGGTDTLIAIENIDGSGYNDTLTGDAGDNQLNGNSGSDSINGGAGSDLLSAGSQYYTGGGLTQDADTLTGGSGTDLFEVVNAISSGRTTRITDFEQGEFIQLGYMTGVAQTILSGDNPAGLLVGQIMVGTPSAGVTRLYVGMSGGTPAYIDLMGSFTASSFVQMSNAQVGNNYLSGSFLKYDPAANLPQSLTGTSGYDTLNGGNANDTINGLDGGDSLQGNGGNDSILGGAGSDTLAGGAGNDTLDGGTNDSMMGGWWAGDRAVYWSAPAAVNVNLATGTASDGQGGTDTLIAIENIDGSGYNDTLTGDAGDNQLNGNSGSDSINGGAGSDLLSAGFQAGAQADLDTLTGGAGTDLFDVSNAMTSGRTTRIADLEQSELIQLSYMSAGAQPILNGDNPAGLLNGQVMVGTPFGGVTRLYVGLSGGTAAFIDLTGNFTASSFVQVSNGQVGNNYLSGNLLKHDPAANAPQNLIGTSAYDSLSGGSANDTINGLEGNDSLQGNGGNDSILGGVGDDYLDGGAGNDTIDGGANGQYGDTLAFAFATTGVNVNLATGTISNDGAGGVDAVSNVEHVNGTSFNDTLVGDGLTNWFRPGLGNDSVDGGAANNDVVMYEDASSGISVNLLTGQATGASIGNDTLVGIEAVHGSFFDDTVTLSNVSSYVFGRGGHDLLTGGNGDDNFIGGSGNDTINGGAGSDQADYQNEDSMGGSASLLAGVTVNLATGTAIDNWGQSDTLTNIEFINGSDYGDRLTGGNPANGSGATDGFEGFRGNGGNDTIDGGAGFDRVYYDRSFGAVNVTLGGTQNGSAQDGAGGTDTLINIEEVRASGFNDVLTGSDTGVFESFEGRAGNDTIDGKGGTDRINYQTSSGGVSVSLVTGSASDGWGGTDTFVNIENVRGSDLNDSIVGDAKDNDLEGRAGNDTLTGGDGQDSLRGGLGDDVLNGGVQRILNGWDATANSSARYDIAYYTDASSGVTVTLGSDGTGGAATGGGIGSDTLIDIEMVIGSVYGDLIRGSNRAVNEIIRGGAGNDTMYGGDAAGTDLGTNFVDYRFGSGGVTVNLASGTATGADGNDVLSGFSGILSGNFNDSLTGDAQDNYIDAGAGNDTIDGAVGLDALSFQNATGGVTANLATGTSSGADGSDTFTNIEGLRGSEFADTLTGDANHNRIQGRDGADVIDGGAGNDTLHGGFGNDTLTGGAGNDLFQYSGGGEGVDRITDFASGDVIAVVAALATGTVVSGTGAGVMAGGIQSSQIAGLTTLYIGTDSIAGADITIELAGAFNASGFSVTTSGGVSQVTYSATNLVITGTAGSDTLTGGVGSDTLSGLGGNDTLNGGAGADSLDGGSGVDTASYADATTPVSVILYGNQAFGVSSGNDTLTAIENILGTAYSDLIYGDAADNVLDGGAGNDTLDGALGNDTLLGQTGDDLLNGLAGNDSLDGGDGNDSLYGWADNDTLVGGVGTDRLFGGAGADRLDGGADADQLEGDDGADTLLGGAGNDTLRGWNDADSLDGGDGDNALFGGAGADSMQAGSGADQLEGDDGNDTIAGGAGNDTLRGWNDNDSMDGGDGNDALFGGAGADAMMGGTGADQLEGDDGNDTITGGTGNDTLRGWNDSDNLDGGDGDDLLVGWSGNDAMNGGAGNDQLFGDDGADTLVGGAGGDVLQGGLGNDVYTFATGFGFDGVRDYDYLAGNSDTFQFTGINRADLSFARVGDALKVERTASAGADVIYVNDWYQAGSNGAFKIETWVMGDASVFTAAQIEAFV